MRNMKIFFAILFVLICIVASAYAQVYKPAPATSNFGMEDAVINVAKAVGPAVVSISTEQTQKLGGGRKFYFRSPSGESPLGGEEEFFKRFFDDFLGEVPQREFKAEGLGSGVIIDTEGYILTNEHVVDGAEKITVTLPDGREFKGEIKGTDKRSDLAVVKINATKLPVAVMGESGNLKIGQWVVAIGNPFGFVMENPEPTVTAGVVSALHRSLGKMFPHDRDFSDLIQTDAAINPGNSGGPLVNLKGEIVGINTAIFSTSGGYQGVGFAIPINNAKKIISKLIEGKKIQYGWLGVTVQNLTDDLVKYFGLADKNGVLVGKVLEDGPAQKAGLKESDIIKKVNNQPIVNAKELISVISAMEVGRKVKLGVIRDKKELTFDVQVGERPESPEEEAASVETGVWRGIAVDDLFSERAQRIKTKEKNGVAVINVEPNTPADDAGIMPGDVITEINKQPVKSTAEYEKITRALKGDALVRTERGFFLVKESEK